MFLSLNSLLDWRRVLVYTHRWLGIGGALLFVAWFVSGIVMMYARMPRLSPEERLRRAPTLELSVARIDPAVIARALAQPPERLRVGMLGERPVYRFYDGRVWSTFFAETGEQLSGLTASDARAIAVSFAPAHVATIRHEGYLTEPDQWTLQVRALLPAHRIELGDADGTALYVSEHTGEVILQTTRQGRFLGYLGAVVHWIYFTPIRRHSDAWATLIIWTSIAGCLLSLFGIAWGVWRYSPRKRYRLRSIHAHSPYAGMMHWHHYAGLIFGVVTFTWIFSGLLSVNPGNWSPSTAPSSRERRAFAGGPLTINDVTLSRVQAAVHVLRESFPVKEIELVRFGGDLFAEAYRVPSTEPESSDDLGDPAAVLTPRVSLDHLLVSMTSPQGGTFSAFDEASLLKAARDAMPGVEVQDASWLENYDAYYYDRHGALPLPVLRLRYADPVQTWLYVNPYRGEIIRKEVRLSRINRWIYHGLHSLDFPWLYRQRPLWDAVVIVLSLGGLVLSVSSAPAAFRRLRRHARRARASFRSWFA